MQWVRILSMHEKGESTELRNSVMQSKEQNSNKKNKKRPGENMTLMVISNRVCVRMFHRQS